MSKYVNNSALTLNTTEYNYGLVAYNENEDVNIYLVNENEISIHNSNNTFSLRKNNNNFLTFEDNTLKLDEVNIKTLQLKELKDIENYISDSHTFISENNEVLEINKEKVHIKNDIYLDGYFNISNIHKLPGEIPLLNKYGKLDAHVLPDSTSNMIYVYGDGSNVGIGTDNPISKLHVYSGDIVCESSYIAINPLSNIEKPECPLHIRHESNRIGLPQMKLTNSKNEDKVIFCSEEPFIGIGTSTRQTYDNIQLYVESNILCKGNIETKEISIGSNIKLNNDICKLNVEVDGDIKFNGKSTRNTILSFYGESNMSFGRGSIDPNYRLDLLNTENTLLSVGTQNNTNPHILFYKNDDKEKGIRLSYEENSNLSINGYNIITENTIGKLGYMDKIELNDLFKNPLYYKKSDNKYIKQIITYINNTFVLLENGTLYHIFDNKAVKYNIWFDELIEKIEEHKGLLFMYIKNETMYYIAINNNSWYGKINNCKSATYDGQYFIINWNNNIYSKHHNDNTNMKLSGTYDIKYFKNKNDMIIFITEDKKLYYRKSNTIYDLLNENVNEYDMNSHFIYVLKEDNKVYKSRIKNKIIGNENVIEKENIYKLGISENNILYILMNNKAILNNIEINLIEGLFNKKALFINGSICNSHLVLLDIERNLLYTKSLLSNNKLGIGRPNGTIYGSYNNTSLVPIAIPLNDGLLNTKKTLTIGNTVNYLMNEDIIDNSLLVENSIGIRIRPMESFALTVNGDINIINGKIYMNGNEIQNESIGEGTGIVSDIDLNGYVKKETFIEERSRVNEEFYKKDYINENYLKLSSNEEIISDIVNEKFDELKRIELENRNHYWNLINQPSYNMLYANKVAVSINTCNLDYIDEKILGDSIIPALYVANYGNIRGAVFDGDIASYSDVSLKDEIKDLKDSLNKVIQLKGRTYVMKDDTLKKKCIGLIAQEVEEIVPEVVSEFKGKKTVSYVNIIGLLIESIKELNSKINLLETKMLN